MESIELMHYGVKGMKWGVRRKSKPYVQDLGGGVSAVWPSKKTYKKAEQKRAKASKKSRLERAADAAQRDADNLRKHGYTTEADAVQKVADKNRQKAERQKQTSKRGAKAVGKALQVAGTLYYADLALTGGAVTRATAKAGKSAVKRTLNNIGDQMFDYAVLDKDGKVLRRYN